MKWLIRTAVALGLLAGLGYASYAFGMFVLSKKLFGDSVMQTSTPVASSPSATITKSVTRKSRDKSARGGAEVNVLDARDAGPGPEAPSLDALERETRARDYDAPRTPSRQRVITAESLKTIKPKNDPQIADGSSNSESAEDRPRKRRRRKRRRSTRTTTSSTTARNDSASTSDSSSSSGDASTRDTSSSSSSGESSSSSSDRPSRRRESSDSEGSSRREKRIESPVPGGGSKSSSGSSSNESPVPVPE